MTTASYVLDIGVYNLGAEAQVRSSTTAAWARTTEGTGSFDSIVYSGSPTSGTFAELPEREWSCGRSFRLLAEAINNDLASSGQLHDHVGSDATFLASDGLLLHEITVIDHAGQLGNAP